MQERLGGHGGTDSLQIAYLAMEEEKDRLGQTMTSYSLSHLLIPYVTLPPKD